MSKESNVIENLDRWMHNIVHKIMTFDTLYGFEEKIEERDDILQSLTVKEIMDKINEFLRTEPDDEDYQIFLNLLAKYPISMCKREVSPMLKYLIGISYRLCIPDGEEIKKGVKGISYEELSRIFGRSKATIYECVKDTENKWFEFQKGLREAEEIKAKAERELIEAQKQKIIEEKENKQTNEQHS